MRIGFRTRRTRPSRTLGLLLAGALAAVGTVAAVAIRPDRADAATSQFRGVNWADQRDNFVNGVLYVSGLGPADTYASAATVADRVVGQMYSLTGANTVRMPVNEPTVASYWGTYTGAIDTALGKGNVFLTYWAYSGGRPANGSAFYQMWDRIVGKYAGNPNAYFEVINEPSGYGATDLANLYNDWLNRYPSVPRDRVILDGSGLAQDAAPVGRDSRLNGTLIAIHDYSFFAGFEDENSWANHINGYIGAYAGRTVVTEWGGPMTRGSKNGVTYDPIDYSIPSGSFFADYIRGVSSQLRTLGVGSVYWPGLRDGDWYSMTNRTGSGSGIQLTLPNASGLTRLRYAWGIGDGGGTYVAIRNASTGRYVDGQGATGNGSTAAQGGDAANANEQWVVENYGSYVRIRNRATGLYLDGMGRTGNGAAVGQYAASGSTNQQWSVLTDANNVRIRNRATGLYVDGAGNGASGAPLVQYGDTNSTNQQWKIVAAG
ncbi:RICIN domain-containing protein [Plantactinospora siamensis]|uniref:RICIN domain-containing protein n=1 Tax=Plantactinospora siamensis TaxID=555372 RepID=A0ABV6P8J4_9ACTN